jgi:hypothetical protein
MSRLLLLRSPGLADPLERSSYHGLPCNLQELEEPVIHDWRSLYVTDFQIAV